MCYNLIVFCLAVCVVGFAGESNALKSGDRGVCDHVVSHYITRKVFHTKVNRQRKCKGKLCIVRVPKIERILEKKKQFVCCAGWQYDSNLDTCQPVCSTGCLNGTCVAPSSCQCDPPLYLEPERKNVCLAPVCDIPCINADCTAPNTCTCRDGYHRRNESTCEPECSYECINGTCTEPDKCSCLPGYTAVNETVCALNDCAPNCDNDSENVDDGQPVCGCVNGGCTASGVCSCFEGYERNVSNPSVCWKPCLPQCGGECDVDGQCPEITCVPISIRKHISDCNSSDIGLCSPTEEDFKCCENWTYNRALLKCEPICSLGCENGTCVAPDKCQCEPPLILRNHSCVPPVCEPACHNAECINDDTCECRAGFHAHNATHCLPICEDGYSNQPERCRPVCSTPCVNATCVAPDTCACLPGYAPDTAWSCRPACRSCEDGDCVAPDVCVCKAGYVQEGGRCVPVCESPCLNGFCSEPNRCSCRDGFEPNALDKFSCDPICEPECTANSTCVDVNSCRCDEGYEEQKDGRCEPVCDRPCVNGYCSMPNICECDEGYRPSSENSFTCIPVCLTECINSTCIAPNICKCLDGYELTNETNICRPKCETCEHGICVAPDACICHDGYNMTDGKCLPICTNSCINGNCSSPEQCSCNDGYKRNDRIYHICYKTCEGPCEEGSCDDDGVCHCKSGFENINGTCVYNHTTRCDDCDSSNEPYRSTTSTSLALLELGWKLGGGLGLLLLVLTMVVMQRLWIMHQEDIVKNIDQEEPDNDIYDAMLSNALRMYPRHDGEHQEDQYEEVHNNNQDKGQLGNSDEVENRL